jgi:hypothetical protein
MNKALSKAQKNHLSKMLSQRQQLEAEMQRYVDYLYEEYEVTPKGWKLENLEEGFEPLLNTPISEEVNDGNQL